MAVFLENIGVIAAKIEGTEGTAETPVGSEAFIAEEVELTTTIEENTREAVNAQDLSPYVIVPGKRSATIKFKTLLKGSGTAGTAPDYGELFKMCKYAETIVAVTSVAYDPVSDGDSSGTIVFNFSITLSFLSPVSTKGGFSKLFDGKNESNFENPP